MSLAIAHYSAVIPTLRYKDALRAIDFLVKAFGFTKQVVFKGADGTVDHAQLTFGGGMIMLGSMKPGDAWDLKSAHPQDAGGKVSHNVYLVVTDAAAAYEKAKAAGAEITEELRVMDYGGGAFACKDLEGYTWSFGEYDPWT